MGVDLRWGGGNFDVLLEVSRDGSYLYPYNSSHCEEFHNRFGGRNYYLSRSGASGAGWIPTRPGLFPVAVYRTDWVGDHIWLDEPNVLDRWTISVPIHYRDNCLQISGAKSPIIIRDHKEEEIILLMDERDIADALSGRLELVEMDRSISAFFEFPEGEDPSMREEVFRWKQPASYKGRIADSFVRRMLGNSSLSRPADPRSGSGECPDFWAPLGLRRLRGFVYLYRQTLAAERVEADKWFAIELPETILPLPLPSGEIGGDIPPAILNVVSGTAVAVFDGECLSSTTDIPPEDRIRAIQGDPDTLRQIWGNLLRKRPDFCVRIGFESEPDFWNLSPEELEVPVSDEDARAVGICWPGIVNFRECLGIPNGEDISIGELRKYSVIPQVSELIEWKLRQIRQVREAKEE